MRFDELDLEDNILDGLDAMNFQETTPVQEQTIPHILAGRDISACAQTGTGKTAAYVLPIINEIGKGLYPDNAVNAIIIALNVTHQMPYSVRVTVSPGAAFLSGGS